MVKSGFLALYCLLSGAAAQLAGRVGPTSTAAQKSARKTCNVLEYGGKAGKTGDIGPAIAKAFAACKTGGVVYVPPGEYGLSTWVALSGGKGFALQIDGVIHRVAKTGAGNMIAITNSDDVELFSKTGQGAIQGNGYVYHRQKDIMGPRILRFVKVTNFSVHDLRLVDSPSFHFAVDSCKNGEIYNIVIHGSYQGGMDGISVWSDNVHVHDIAVTNKDECVTIKSPAHNVLVENIYCNWSGGSAFGSLGTGVDIKDIYRNVYTIGSNQMMMIKSNGGSGSAENILLENFIGHKNAYSFNIDQQWSSMKANGGAGVQLRNVTVSNWKGTCQNGAQRGPIKVICANGRPCTGITIRDFAIWTEAGSSLANSCANAYGSGACIKAGSGGGYATVKQTVSSPPAGYQAATLPTDFRSAPSIDQPIPIPNFPPVFFPGIKPLKPLALSV